MPHVLGIDHVAFAAADLEATCAFYDRLFGARTHLEYAPDGRSLVRQIALGGALLSVHQEGLGPAEDDWTRPISRHSPPLRVRPSAG